MKSKHACNLLRTFVQRNLHAFDCKNYKKFRSIESDQKKLESFFSQKLVPLQEKLALLVGFRDQNPILRSMEQGESNTFKSLLQEFERNLEREEIESIMNYLRLKTEGSKRHYSLQIWKRVIKNLESSVYRRNLRVGVQVLHKLTRNDAAIWTGESHLDDIVELLKLFEGYFSVEDLFLLREVLAGFQESASVDEIEILIFRELEKQVPQMKTHQITKFVGCLLENVVICTERNDLQENVSFVEQLPAFSMLKKIEESDILKMTLESEVPYALTLKVQKMLALNNSFEKIKLDNFFPFIFRELEGIYVKGEFFNLVEEDFGKFTSFVSNSSLDLKEFYSIFEVKDTFFHLFFYKFLTQNSSKLDNYLKDVKNQYLLYGEKLLEKLKESNSVMVSFLFKEEKGMDQWASFLLKQNMKRILYYVLLREKNSDFFGKIMGEIKLLQAEEAFELQLNTLSCLQSNVNDILSFWKFSKEKTNYIFPNRIESILLKLNS